MVAQFLRLKLTLLSNSLRRPPVQVFGMVVSLALGATVTWSASVAIVGLRGADAAIVGPTVIATGSLVVFLAAFLPLVFGADDRLDPRAFATIGIAPTRLALGLGVAALVSVATLAIAAIGIAAVVAVSDDAIATVFAVLAVPVAIATCMLAARITAALSTLLLQGRRERELTGLIALAAGVVIAPAIVLTAFSDWESSTAASLASFAAITAWTPLGAVWAAPAAANAGDVAGAFGWFLLAVVYVGALAYVWRALVARMLVTTHRERAVRHVAGLGIFRSMPATAFGVIAARSVAYWLRDPRYRASLAIVPFVPAAMIGVLAIAGIPLAQLALLPVPIMCLFIGWGTVHNDLAYDHTAVWLHLAADTPGWADRLGRIVPPLAVGLLVIAVGAPISAWAYGHDAAIGSIAGVSICALLTALGVSSVASARFPYPAAHPGNSAFAQPQSTASGAGAAQAYSLLAVLLIATPTVLVALNGIRLYEVIDGGQWHSLAFLAGAATGIIALVVGILWGGRIFEKRAPELLAFTMRY